MLSLDELLSSLLKPVMWLVSGVVRGVWYFFAEYICWTIGWVVLRAVTLGHYPPGSVRLDDREVYRRDIVIVAGIGFALLLGACYAVSELL